HVSVCRFDQLPESRCIDVTIGTEFHMAHELAGALQQALGIGKLGAAKETDIDVISEGIDVRERRIADTRGRVAIVQYLANIVSAAAHDGKPALRDHPQLARMLLHPALDRWIALDRTGEPEKLAHGNSPRDSAALTRSVSEVRRRNPSLTRRVGAG